MQLDRRTRRLLRLQSLVFVVLFVTVIGLAGWLAVRYPVQMDWTAGGRNTLSAASRELIAQVDGRVRVTAFAREDEALRKAIGSLVGRYQREKPDLELRFVNPDTVPEQVRELDISVDGSLVIEYQGRREVVSSPGEEAISNALYRVARSDRPVLVFVSGHGERDPTGQANHDLGDWSRRLSDQGVHVVPLNLARSALIPDNTAALVVAGPRLDFMPGEVELIQDYLHQGGNLLWLAEPGRTDSLEAIAETLGVRFLPGVVVDATTQMFGIDDPAFALVTDYPPHPLTRGFLTTTLFPQAAALEVEEGATWDVTPLLETLPRSWTELGEITGDIRYDEGTDERPGPLLIGVALSRELEESKDGGTRDAATGAVEQRVVVIGDGDFVSNAYIGNGANLDLGLSLANWLMGEDRFVAIPARAAPDLQLDLSPALSVTIAVGFLLALPLLLLGSGLAIWHRRRRR